MASIMESLAGVFKSSPPETPPAGGMTFEQRAALIGALYELTKRGRRPLSVWQQDLWRALSYADATRPLAEAALQKIDRESDEDKEERLSEIARSGLRLAENHPIAAFGGDVRHLIAETVESTLAKSGPVRLARLLLPALLALMVGGVLWGTFKVEGLRECAQSAGGSGAGSR